MKITRGTTNPEYQQPIEEVWLFVSETNYVGDFSFSNRFSTQLVGGAVSDIFDKEITIRTKGQFPEYSRNPFGTAEDILITKNVHRRNVHIYTRSQCSYTQCEYIFF